MQPTMAATLLLSAPPLRGSRKPPAPDLEEEAGAEWLVLSIGAPSHAGEKQQ
jgi:hypothetical protein